ncbi:fatty acid desaturase [Pseudomonas sp. R3-52-08]|uniref:fatty acid desaturase family protein n=1 Tax=Pseudomonas sp. R3-52-08 TaxID=1173284 RepID=UPI000F706478|nr:fatty acid desaturase [Pseudomonas sp. R3-52-08]AZF21177.1 Fatty acid desaturase [Pseudomonas sp. R3-52-08]
MNKKLASKYIEMINRSDYKPNDVTFGLRVVVWFVLMLLGGWFISKGGGLSIIGVILVGAMFAHGVELQHQALHYTGFSSRKMNYYIGVILGLPMLVSFTSYRKSHISHHRLLGTPDDLEFFNTKKYCGRKKKISYQLNNFFMLMHFYVASSKIMKSIDPLQRSKKCPKIDAKEYRLMLTLIILLTAISIACESPIIIFYWLIPLLIVAAPLHYVIELPEHHGCTKNTIDIFSNTRSISSNWLMYWFVNGNNFHVEHHLVPGLPMQKTRLLHALLKHDLQHCSPSYINFYNSLSK